MKYSIIIFLLVAILYLLARLHMTLDQRIERVISEYFEQNYEIIEIYEEN